MYALQRQYSAFKTLEYYMINIKCRKPGTKEMRAQKFQNGTRLTINSLIGLQKYMECKHGVPYLMCSHCDQAKFLYISRTVSFFLLSKKQFKFSRVTL